MCEQKLAYLSSIYAVNKLQINIFHWGEIGYQADPDQLLSLGEGMARMVRNEIVCETLDYVGVSNGLGGEGHSSTYC